MRRTLFIPRSGSLAVALALTALGGPAAAATAPPPEPSKSVAVDIVTALEDEDAQDLEHGARRQIAHQLARNEVRVTPDSPGTLTIRVGWLDDARTTYAVGVVLACGGEVLAEEEQSCEFCSTTELFEGISFAVARVIRELPTDTPPPRAEPEPPLARPIPTQHDDLPEEPALGALGWAGVGITAAGVVALSVGSGLWAKGESARVDPRDPTLLEVRNYRRPGISLVAAGGSSVVAGVVMLAVDTKRQRRRRWALSPRVSRRFAGVTVGGRF